MMFQITKVVIIGMNDIRDYENNISNDHSNYCIIKNNDNNNHIYHNRTNKESLNKQRAIEKSAPTWAREWTVLKGECSLVVQGSWWGYLAQINNQIYKLR